jgi:hypothetical protein
MMDTSKTDTNERAKAQHRKWYDENREDYNALRRQRYATDKETRAKARDRAATYRGQVRAGKRSIERELTRELNGKTVRVYSTGEVAEAMGRTPQMLRNWENAELIPPSSFPDKHRLYTRSQMRMIVALESIIGANNGSWSHPKVKSKIRAIRKRW